ncbi:MAG TPA: metallophosphoesterase family protein [Anseongella sp.]
MRIGLISDTHGVLDKAVFTHFDQCDEIWHAGDFGTMAVAEELAAFRPLKGVYGNIDGRELRVNFPETAGFTCQGLKVIMRHIGGYPGRYAPGVRALLEKERPGLFIAGHSHILKVIHDKRLGLLHVNPGAAGREGFHKVRTLIRFSIDEAKIHDLEVIELPKR